MKTLEQIKELADLFKELVGKRKDNSPKIYEAIKTKDNKGEDWKIVDVVVSDEWVSGYNAKRSELINKIEAMGIKI